MLIANFRYTASECISANLIVSLINLFVTGMILSGSVSYGDILTAATWRSTKQCELSLQLQQTPYREEYIAKLATEVGKYWASNNDATTVADDSDDSGPFTFISFGKENSSDYQSGTIDSFSRDCLTCHDGTRATDVAINYRNSPGGFSGKRYVKGKDHPIGMDYASYAAFDRGYKPLAMLNSKMMLINGKVGCLTCHNPLNPENKHLVMSDFGSALCLTCHNK